MGECVEALALVRVVLARLVLVVEDEPTLVALAELGRNVDEVKVVGTRPIGEGVALEEAVEDLLLGLGDRVAAEDLRIYNLEFRIVYFKWFSL